MAIKIKQPAMACNADDVPGARYRMQNTMEVHLGTPVASLAMNIRDVAKSFPTKPPQKVGDKWIVDIPMKNLILNGHGAPGQVKLGQWINWTHVKEFERLRGLVGTIWITACRVGGREPEDDLDLWDIAGRVGDKVKGWVKGRPPAAAAGNPGDDFCFRLAFASGAKVIASPQYQLGALYVPDRSIDGYEGLAYVYSPDDRTKKRSKNL